MSGRRPILRLLCFAAVFVAAVSAQGSTEWGKSVAEARAQAESSNRLILVDLYADWCHWCKRLESDVFSTEEFQLYSKKFVLLRVDTEDGAEGADLQEKFSAYNLPTILLVDHRLVEFGRVEGYAPTDQFIGVVEREIAEFRALEAGYERFADTNDPGALAVLADEFHKRGDGKRASSLYRRLLETDTLDKEKANWTRLQLADALRLDEQFDLASQEVSDARDRGRTTGNQDLIERLDLVQAQISLDRGDCSAARSELRRFLLTHPASQLRPWAQRTLDDLDTDPSTCA
ncbi:MAG: thioredoxin family protein [Thermoanaerobaculia bacterium]|jgi:thioredoxin-related protein